MTPRRAAPAAALAGLVAGLVLRRLGRAAGSTRAERRASLPGDDLVGAPHLVTDHATSIAAPADRVWPWLTQVGWHRAGWYTPRWVDRLLFPANLPSADRLDPRWVRELRIGDVIPDGPPGTAEFTVVRVLAPAHLVLLSTSHLPPGWDVRRGARMRWTWCFRLSPSADGGTRVHLRVRGRCHPWWLRTAYRLAILPADAVMGPGMLRGLRRRVEAAATEGGRTPATGIVHPGRSRPVAGLNGDMADAATTVYLLDDHEVVRQGLRSMLEATGEIVVVGESGSAREAAARIPALRPDVAILDARLPDGSGIEVCRSIRSVDPSLRALVLTSFDDDEALLAAIMAGASGYVLKDVRVRDLLEAITRVAAGESLMDPALVARVRERVRRGPALAPELAGLTEQELRLLHHIADGLTNREISERMFLAEKTVKNYVSALLHKLGLQRRTQAAVLATRLLRPPD